MFFSENSLLLAAVEAEDLIKVGIAVLWFLIWFVAKLFKKGKDENFTEETEYSEEDEYFEEDDNPREYGNVSAPASVPPQRVPAATPPPMPEENPLVAILKQQREQAEMARRRRLEEIQEKLRRQAASQAAHAEASRSQSLPKKAHSVPAKAGPASPSQEKLSDLLDDRDALRRAILAQEILSPPLALRDRQETPF